MQQLKLLESFLAVARSKSIREAAEATHLTSSALNRRILDLEDELGVPLFDRHARGIRLTSAGEAYLAYAVRAIRDAQAVQSQIDDLRGLRRGNIDLAVIAVAANDRLTEIIANFQRQYPKIAFSVHVAGADEVVASVLESRADLGVAFNLSAEKDFYEIAERRYVMCAVVRSDHPSAGKAGISLNECANYPIALADRSWGGRKLLDEYLSRTGFRLTPQLVSNSYAVLTSFVKRTNGVCFQIRPEQEHVSPEDGLAAIPVAEMARYARPMVLGALRGRVLPVAAALFGETLKRELFG
ncbi:MAG TPA: LysR family transcriptional regulator [Bordetella sp.]|nr:LysR family transcriptional regulator [Bordetella sp.]